MDEKNLDKFSKFIVSYSEYHYNIINKLIHIICIPIIFFTLMILFNYLNIELYNKDELFCLNFSVIFMLVNFLIYLYVNIFAGTISFLVFSPFIILARSYYLEYKNANNLSYLFLITFIFHLLGWIIQIVGHKFFEKRKPAVSDNVLLSIIAPFFVIVEILWFFGWKKDDMKKINVIIENKIKNYHKNLENNNLKKKIK